MSDSNDSDDIPNPSETSEYNFNIESSNDGLYNSLPPTSHTNENIYNSLTHSLNDTSADGYTNESVESTEPLDSRPQGAVAENGLYDVPMTSQLLFDAATAVCEQNAKKDEDGSGTNEENTTDNVESGGKVDGSHSQPSSESESYMPLTSQSLYATATIASGQSLASKKDDDDRKIFVGGLHWETNIEDLKEYFSSFGSILDVTLKTDVGTGRSRGFGFVLFDDISSVDKVMEQKSHILHGKTIDPKRAVTRLNGVSGAPISKDPCKKIFVGGISPDMPETDIRNFFSKYGKIEEVELPFDRVKNMRRAYVFLTFESEKCAEDACLLPKQKIGEREVDVRKATPRNENQGPKGMMDYSSMYPPGYDYSQYYGTYGYGYPGYPGYGQAPGYDYSAYYNQDWSQYATQYPQQYAYPPTAFPNAAAYPQGQYDQTYGYPQGYDYSAWYAAQGQQPPPQGQQPPTQMPPANGQTPVVGKVKQEHHAPTYHPYAR